MKSLTRKPRRVPVGFSISAVKEEETSVKCETCGKGLEAGTKMIMLKHSVVTGNVETMKVKFHHCNQSCLEQMEKEKVALFISKKWTQKHVCKIVDNIIKKWRTKGL